jgi:methionyl-tRNA synthetase
MDGCALETAVAAAFRIVDAANEFIASTEPWALARNPANAHRLTQVLFDVAESVRVAAILLLPVMPGSCAEILRRVGEATPPSNLRLPDAQWRNHGERMLLKGDPLWPRASSVSEAGSLAMADAPTTNRATPSGPQAGNKTQRSTQVEDSRTPGASAPSSAAPTQPAAQPSSATTPAAAAGSDRISIEDFMKVDLRVAKVLAAEKVPNSRKLVKLNIDVGTEQRTLVAGIAEAYEPEALVGRTIVMVFNLKPAKLMGIESNGMVLAASPDGGKPTLVGFDQDIAPGTRVR